ncbi:MAG: hypothetical protein WC700_04000 [Gemmatimonadaceae bacterium]|jgi:hypothetical protein
MLSSMAAKPTIEGVVTRYRREVAQGGPEAHLELEVRFQDVDREGFEAVYRGLLERRDERFPGPPKLTQVVSVIMDVRAGRGEGAMRHLRPARIREVYYENSARVRTQFVYKEPLLLPVRVSGPGLPYLVALSSERPTEEFSSDEEAVIRVKARVSFPLRLAGTGAGAAAMDWRVDLTVTRRIEGSDAASSLQHIVNQMFRGAPKMTAENLLSALSLESGLYRFEIEVEFVGGEDVRDAVRPADTAAAADAIMQLVNPNYVRAAALQAEVFRAARYLISDPRRFQHDAGLKSLLPQVFAVTRATYRKIFPPRDFYLTDKADGRRALAVAHDSRGFVVADTYHEYSAAASSSATAADTIADGELVRAADGTLTVYVFDVLVVAGENITADPFEKRLERLREAVEILRAVGVPAAAKEYARIVGDTPRELERVIRGVHEARRPYTTDGLIFVEPGQPYMETQSYKWKSARDNTIDFLARRAPPSVLGREPFVDRPGHRLYFLFVGVTPELHAALGQQRCPGYADLFPGGGTAQPGSHFPIQFAPSDVPLAYLYQHPDASPAGEIEGKIVEARCLGDCGAAGGGAAFVDWEVTRIREDRASELATRRYFGNDFHTAEMIWLNYVDPFPVEQLWEGPSLDYFMREKSGVYAAQTAVISYVKTQRILTLRHADWVIDVGAGQGQDLGRYLEAEVRHLIAVDEDRAALSELVRRKYTQRGHGRRGRGRRDDDPPAAAGRRGGATTVHVLAADAGAPHAETLARLAVFGFRAASADALVCNLAVHYFLRSAESMRNFIALARGAVKVGGTVVLTVLLGEAVHALFRAQKVAAGSTWDLRENGALKYSLRRDYTGEMLENAGQRVGVLLPFSDGRYYEEFLVNTAALTREFVARGFSVVAETRASDAIPEFASRNRQLAAALTAADRQWLALYGERVYRREK